MKFFRYLLAAIACMAMAACSKTEETHPVPPPPPPPPETTYAVGDHYKEGLTEGIVVTVNEEGKHGMIVSLDETQLKWSTEKVLVGNNGLFVPDNGNHNMSIIKKLTDWDKKYPACKWCDSKNFLGLSGWFFPSNDEIGWLYVAFTGQMPEEDDGDTEPEGIGKMDRTQTEAKFNKALTDAGGTPITRDAYYWTSMEVSANAAYCMDFRNGQLSPMTNGDKEQLNRVRAMKKF